VRTFGWVAAAASGVAGLFAIFAPLVAWVALGLGFLTAVSRDPTVEAASSFALFGSWALAASVVIAAPLGLVAGLASVVAARLDGGTVLPGLAGAALNLVAPVTWVLTWAGVVGGLLYLFQDFHF
jgi:hypothetical protein